MAENPGSRATLLLVEDDEQVRRFVRSLLSSENLNIIEARTGAEGLRAAKAPVPIDILLTDMLLPELSGYDLAIEVRLLFPAVRIIMMTGYIEGEIVQRGVSELHASFIDKPFPPAELRRLVAEAISSRQAAGARPTI
jgi:two-component system, cell cycle sensor histidine kinase and response regulator CckA